MNAVEKIEAAIERLETLKAESNRGPWSQIEDEPYGITQHNEDGHVRDIAWASDAEDAVLIVTLHRTIDAQLAILRDTFNRYADKAGTDWEPNPGAPAAIGALALADAILGGES